MDHMVETDTDFSQCNDFYAKPDLNIDCDSGASSLRSNAIFSAAPTAANTTAEQHRQRYDPLATHTLLTNEIEQCKIKRTMIKTASSSR